MKLVIVSTFWNSEKHVSECIKSLKSQYYTNFVAYFIDDVSTDNSYDVAKNSINGDDRFILIRNTEKKYKTKNFIDVIRHNNNIDWDDVIIELDGDDKLSNPYVLGQLTKIYSNDKIWICGSKWSDKNGNSMKYGRANADNPRGSTWNFSHLRTYRAFLFRLIKDEHLRFNGEYFKAAVDLGMGMPMLEMAGNEHYYFLDEVTYIYTWHENQTYSDDNSFGDSKLQGKIAKYIYGKLPKYKKLELVEESEMVVETTKTSMELLTDVLGSIKDKPFNTKPKEVDYEKINQVINKNKKVDRVVKTVKENTPKNRENIIEIKKGSLADKARTFPPKPNRKDLIPNVFTKNKRKF